MISHALLHFVYTWECYTTKVWRWKHMLTSPHCSDIIMKSPASRLVAQPSTKTPKFPVTGLCEGRWPVGFPHKRPSNAENVSIWWRHHVSLSSTRHYTDVIMTTMASQISSLTIVYSTIYSDADQRKHQSFAPLAFVRGIHRDRWIPRTNDQLRGKCFHLMTSSWTACEGNGTRNIPTENAYRHPGLVG